MERQTTRSESPSQAFRLAVQRVGGQSRMAELIGRTQGAISKVLSQDRPIWAECVLTVEARTGISRHDLRPDIYPVEDAGAHVPPARGLSDGTPAAGSPRFPAAGVSPSRPKFGGARV